MEYNFDPSTVPAASFDPIPDAWYALTLVDIQQKQNSANDGSWRFELQFQVSEMHHPDIGKRRIYTNLNLGSAKPDTVAIAQRVLAAYLNAAGIKEMKNTDQMLTGRPVAAKVIIRKGTPQYPEDRNEIRAFDSLAAREKDLRKPGAKAPESGNKPGATKPGGLPWE